MEKYENFAARHADKGEWKVDLDTLKSNENLTEDEYNLIANTLNELGVDKIPLTEKGLVRSVKMGNELFEYITKNKKFNGTAILLSQSSLKDRAQLTKLLATNRVAQLESINNKDKADGEKITIHEAEVEDREIAELLKDASDESWEPYQEMMKKEKISEFEALLRYFRDINRREGSDIDKKNLLQSAQRYRDVIIKIRKATKVENAPLFIFAVGHGGPIGQLKYEAQKGDVELEDIPQFGEILGFDNKGNFLGETKKVEI